MKNIKNKANRILSDEEKNLRTFVLKRDITSKDPSPPDF